MNKDDLITQITTKENITRKKAEKAIKNTIDGIVSVMKNGERLTLVGFGSFKIWNREPRKARNPLTGEVVQVPEKNYVTFVPGEDFKDAINLKKALDGAKKKKDIKDRIAKKNVKTRKIGLVKGKKKK